MAWSAIEPADWSAFLASFTGRHEGWLVRLGGNLEQLGQQRGQQRGQQVGEPRVGHAVGQGPHRRAGAGGTGDGAGGIGDGWWPLRELRYDPIRDRDEVVVVLGPSDEQPGIGRFDRVELRVPQPRRVAIEQTSQGVERALAVAGLRERLTLRLRSAVSPDRVDGPTQ